MDKIVIFIPRFGMGGISKIGSFVANALSDDYEVMIVSLINDEKTTFLRKEIVTESLNYDYDDSSMSYFTRQFMKIRTIFRLRNLIRYNRIDLICSFGLDLGRIALLSKTNSCLCLVSERGNPYRYNHRQKRKYDRVMKKADVIVFQTNMAREAFSNISIIDKSYIIPNPAIGRSEVNHTIHTEQRDKRIVYCGRLSKEKNIGMLIEAFAILDRRDYQLVIYGKGPEYDHLINIIKEYDLGENIEIISDCYDVFSREGNSEIFVLPSDEEGMPNALIEAMLCGMACIATDCPPGGCHELLMDGERGILIPVRDVYGLVHALEKLIVDKKYAKKLGEAAKTIAITQSADVIISKWKKVVEELTQS